MKTCISIMVVVCALGGTAFAQDSDESTDSSSDSAPTDSTTPTDSSGSASAGGSASADTSSMGGGGGGGAAYKMGIGASLNSAADIPAAHLFYALGANYLDATVGFSLDNLSPDEGDSANE